MGEYLNRSRAERLLAVRDRLCLSGASPVRRLQRVACQWVKERVRRFKFVALAANISCLRFRRKAITPIRIVRLRVVRVRSRYTRLGERQTKVIYRFNRCPALRVGMRQFFQNVNVGFRVLLVSARRLNVVRHHSHDVYSQHRHFHNPFR